MRRARLTDPLAISWPGWSQGAFLKRRNHYLRGEARGRLDLLEVETGSRQSFELMLRFEVNLVLPHYVLKWQSACEEASCGWNGGELGVSQVMVLIGDYVD